MTAFVGIWGVTFLIAWFASTFEWAWSRGFDWSVVRTPVVAMMTVLGAIVLAGANPRPNRNQRGRWKIQIVRTSRLVPELRTSASTATTASRGTRLAPMRIGPKE